MNARTRSRLAWSIALASVAITVVFVILAFAIGLSDDPAAAFLTLATVIAIAPVGATIAARTGNAVGWALLAVIGTVAVWILTDAYATYAFVISERALPLAAFALWLETLTFFLSLLLFVAIPLLYPSGTPRWRWVWRAYVVATTSTILGFAILPGDMSLSGGYQLPNPYAIDAMKGPVGVILAVAGTTVLVCIILSIVALILRYREARGDERQQIRWLAYVGIAAALLFLVNLTVSAKAGENSLAAQVASYVFFGTALLGIPAACAVAILKYHLYDLDVVIRKTLVFGLLAVFISTVYAGIVGGIGALVSSSGSTTLSFAAAAALAVLFQPARDRARRFADRLVYGKRATPYEVLSEFSGRMSEAYATEDVLPRMAEILRAGTGASSARVLLRIGGELHEIAAFGEGVGEEEVTKVVHQGEDLGALEVTMPAADPMNPAKQKLVRDLASQAGLVLRNVRLIEELRASRQRLVVAQDEERRKIERNLHDGAQQQLLAMQVKLKLADQLLENEPVRGAALLSDLQRETGEALETLRDLARGIYPPLLADKGLFAALEAQSRKSPVPTTVEVDGVDRYLPEVETTVYFCALEALQNVAKYAGATAANVRLSAADGNLTFEVVDDGTGFDPASTGYGTGLQGMADRLDAIGGQLAIETSPEHGTTVKGLVPVETTAQ